MRLKRAIAMLAASAVCLGVFAGCGKEETVQQNHKIGLAMSLEDTALSILSNEVASYAESTGTELVKYNAEDDYETQLEQIAQCKADGCEAVIIVQTKNDAESTKAMIEAADGMEVIFANRMPAEECLSDTVLYVGSDESVAGEYQGRYIADELTAQGKLTATGVMIMGNAGLAHTEKRTETAKSTINESGITVDWVLEQDCGYNREQAREAVICTAFFKLDIVCNGSQGCGIIHRWYHVYSGNQNRGKKKCSLTAQNFQYFSVFKMTRKLKTEIPYRGQKQGKCRHGKIEGFRPYDDFPQSTVFHAVNGKQNQ